MSPVMIKEHMEVLGATVFTWKSLKAQVMLTKMIPMRAASTFRPLAWVDTSSQVTSLPAPRRRRGEDAPT